MGQKGGFMTAKDNGSLDTPQERKLAGTLAGVLFLTAAAGVPSIPLLPGGATSHWPWLIGIATACAIWGALCLWVIHFENVPRIVFWAPGLLALVLIAVVMACTGGANSPARFYCFFVLVFGTYFLAPREAYVYIAGCVAVHASPLLYDSGDQYVGEVMVMSTAYVLLGVLLMRGKGLLVELRARANQQALHDPLTDLPNRRAMLAWLENALDPEEKLGPVGLVLVDLDGFKDVNTVHGYPEGDRVLCETARVLEGCVRDDDMVARLGGDEFAVLAVRASEAGMRALAQRVLDATRGLHDRLDLGQVHLTASVGWVMYPNDADTIDELIATADVCMRGAKATGKDRALSVVDWTPETADQPAV
jgi:diguanylate cyclase (GGDEF)-like protein